MKKRLFIVVLSVLCFTSGFAQSTHNTSGSNLYRAGRVSYQTSDSGKRLLFGIGVGAGFTMLSSPYGYVNFDLSFAYPITNNWGMGAYFQIGPEMADGPDPGYKLSAGVLATIGNYSSGNGSVLLGVGGGLDDNYSSWDVWERAAFGEIKGGYLLQNGLYFIGELGIGEYNYKFGYHSSDGYYHDNRSSGPSVHVGARIGYNFGRFIKCR